MKITKLTHTIGAEISGIDLANPLTVQQNADLKNALLENHVLFFRDQQLAPEYLPTVIRQFGDIFLHTTQPKYNNNHLIGHFVADENTTFLTVEGRVLHADRTSVKHPPRTSMLYVTECPDVGGDTVFVNTVAAYESLSDTEKLIMAPLYAMHMSPGASRAKMVWPPTSSVDQMGRPQCASHPIIATIPETGKKFINVNEGFTIGIPELSVVESNHILSKLFYTILNPRFSCRFKWTPNTIAWWDNFGTQHQAIWDYHPSTRVGFRVLSANLY
jgi:taurine dioxygenase